MLPKHIILNSDGNRGFFIDLRTGELYTLNSTGLRILQILESGIPVNQVADIIAAEFNVDRDHAGSDVEVFMESIGKLETLQ